MWLYTHTPNPNLHFNPKLINHYHNPTLKGIREGSCLERNCPDTIGWPAVGYNQCFFLVEPEMLSIFLESSKERCCLMTMSSRLFQSESCRIWYGAFLIGKKNYYCSPNPLIHRCFYHCPQSLNTWTIIVSVLTQTKGCHLPRAHGWVIYVQTVITLIHHCFYDLSVNRCTEIENCKQLWECSLRATDQGIPLMSPCPVMTTWMSCSNGNSCSPNPWYTVVFYRVSQLKRNTFQWFIVLRLEGKYLCIWYGVVE